MGLWIAEELRARRILIFTPSLAIVKQTLEGWARESRRPFAALAVCSDRSVCEDIRPEEVFLGRVSTAPAEVRAFWRARLRTVSHGSYSPPTRASMRWPLGSRASRRRTC